MTVHITTANGSRYVIKERKDGKMTIKDGLIRGIITTLRQPIENGRELDLMYKDRSSDEEERFLRSTPIASIRIEP